MNRDSLWSMIGKPFLGCMSKWRTASRTAAGVLGVHGVPGDAFGPISADSPWNVADVFGVELTVAPGSDRRRDVDGGTAP